MKKLKIFALATLALLGFSGAANAETVILASDDFVGISFWVISMGMLAFTVFFLNKFQLTTPAGPGDVIIGNLIYCILHLKAPS